MSKKTAIVTGASRGIGKACALSLAEKSHRVIAIARSEHLLQKLEEQYPDSISYIQGDLTHNADLKKIETSLKEKRLQLDILINNAGALIRKPFRELTNEDWQSMLNANLLSAINLTKKVLPWIKEKGHIVNVSSMGGFQGSSKFPGLTAYSVAKGAMSIWSECLAAELKADNIAVNALCLGSVQTEMFHEAFPGFEAATKPNKMGSYIADFALNGSTFYNGKVLPVALNDPS